MSPVKERNAGKSNLPIKKERVVRSRAPTRARIHFIKSEKMKEEKRCRSKRWMERYSRYKETDDSERKKEKKSMRGSLGIGTIIPV